MSPRLRLPMTLDRMPTTRTSTSLELNGVPASKAADAAATVKSQKHAALVHRLEWVFEPGANDGAGPITLDPETRERFARALAEMFMDAIVRRQQHGKAK